MVALFGGASMLRPTFDFPPLTPATRRQQRRKRPLGNKLQEIGMRSPDDIIAFDVLADMVLDRLDDEERQLHKA